MFQVSIRCLLLVSAAQSCWHRGNIKYGRRICLHCPRTPSSRGETTFTLAELPPSTETSRFLWGSFRMIDAVSIFNPSLSLKETSSSPFLTFCCCRLLRKTLLFAPLPECQIQGGGCFLWIPDVKREWNEVNTCLVMTSMHFSKMFARMGNVVVAHWPCNDAVERVSFNNGCRRFTTAPWKESAIKRTVNEWTCKRERYIYV